MKKVILFVALFIGGILAAQERTETEHVKRDCGRRPGVGLKAGTNLSNSYYAQGDFNTQPVYGFAGGGFLIIPLSKYLGMQTEVIYSQKGFKSREGSFTAEDNLVRTNSYIDIPLMITVRPFCPLTFVAGPNFSYLIKQTDTFSDGTGSVFKSEDFKSNNIRRNTIGAVMGADINIWNLVLSGRCGFDIQSNYRDLPASAPRYKNIWLQGTIGFRIF